jgi:hypothetical protein|tara:strand:+ start:1127 stop:1501 length:375 start_codon:yes stop_codon:yes gene_type:complete
MLNLLVGLGSQVVSGYLETKKAKAENKLTEIKAKTDILNKQIKGEIDFDIEAIKGNKDSYKDEWLTFLFSIPLVLAFIPGCEDIVSRGFEALEKCPTWYKAAVSAMIASVFSLRGAKAFMNRKK